MKLLTTHRVGVVSVLVADRSHPSHLAHLYSRLHGVKDAGHRGNPRGYQCLWVVTHGALPEPSGPGECLCLTNFLSLRALLEPFSTSALGLARGSRREQA